MPPEIWLLALFLAFALLVGVPLVRASVWLPKDLQIEQVPDPELGPKQSEHFRRIDAEASALQYRPAFSFRVVNFQGRNINRLYLNAADPALLLASAMLAAPAVGETEPAAGASYEELVSRFDDGTMLTTRNVLVSSVFPSLPGERVQDLPGAAVATLKRRHDRRSAELRTTRAPVFARETEVLDRIRDHHRRFCEQHAERGYLRLDAAAGLYRATSKAALRGILNYLNPLADNFTLGRFALGVLVGAGLTAGAGMLLGASSPLARAAGEATGIDSAFCALAFQFLAFTVAGLVIGSVFQAKCYVWGLLLGYLPLRILGTGGAVTVGLALWLGAVADWTARFRLRRENVA